MKYVTQALADAKEEPTAKEISDAESYYIENVGTMETANESSYSEEVLDHLAANFVSPVQRVEQQSDPDHYGIINYVEGDEWYGFYAYDSRSVGRRVIGVQNTDSVTYDSELTHVSAGDPTGSFADQPNASYDTLTTELKKHYDENIGKDRSMPSSITRPTDTVTATNGKYTGPKSARTRGKERAKKFAKGRDGANRNL